MENDSVPQPRARKHARAKERRAFAHRGNRPVKGCGCFNCHCAKMKDSKDMLAALHVDGSRTLDLVLDIVCSCGKCKAKYEELLIKMRIRLRNKERDAFRVNALLGYACGKCRKEFLRKVFGSPRKVFGSLRKVFGSPRKATITEVVLVPLSTAHLAAWYRANHPAKDCLSDVSQHPFLPHISYIALDLDPREYPGCPDHDNMTLETVWRTTVPIHRGRFIPTGQLLSHQEDGGGYAVVDEHYLNTHTQGPYAPEHVQEDGSSSTFFCLKGHIMFEDDADQYEDNLGLQVCSHPFNVLAENALTGTWAWVEKTWADEITDLLKLT